MRTVFRREFILPVLLFCLFFTGSQALADTKLQGRVTWVYDGDTIYVAGVGKVRLLGIDVPEKEASPRDRYLCRRGVAPATLRRIHNHAHTFLLDHALGQNVFLSTEPPERDTYGRLLAYVILPDDNMLNRLLLERGLAVVYRRFDFSGKEDFLRAEKEARLAGRGVWESSD